jgi:molecular chaperone HtpG
MTDEEKSSREAFEYRAEIRQLLHILAHSLYTDREIFLRELISNASDALHRIQFEMHTNRDVVSPEAELAIHIDLDDEAKTITVSDSGIGMTRDELIENLGTIAHSGVGAYLRDLGEKETPAADIIGQFGVGFYSAFMVAEELRVVSRSYRPEAEPFEWVSTAGDSYTIGPAEREKRGTSVIVQLKEDAAEFANTWKLEQIIKKHSNYIPFPIYLGDRVINQKTALWRQLPSEVTDEKHHEFYRQLTLDFEKPLTHLHINTDAPVQVFALLYIPSKRERGPLALRTDFGLRLYAKKVLIQEYAKDLLPNHFRFIEGVVDTEELPLNISRETIQSSRAMERVRKVLETRVLKALEKQAEDEPDTYAHFWKEFGVFIKEGIATDFAGRDKLLPLLRFHSSRSADGDLVSLADYVGRMKENQNAIYYLLGEDLTSVASSPHLDYFRAHEVEVLYLVDPIDSFMMMGLQEYEGKSFQNVDDAGLELPEGEVEAVEGDKLSEKDFDRLKERCVDVLGGRITQVREARTLKDSPCRLVSPEDAPAKEMQRVYRILNQEFEVPKKILELNRRHPLIQNLTRLVVERPDEPLINPVIEQLYENGLLIEGIHPNPAAMAPRIQSLLEAAVANAQAG